MAHPPPKVNAPIRKKLQKIEMNDGVFTFVVIASEAWYTHPLYHYQDKKPHFGGFFSLISG